MPLDKLVFIISAPRSGSTLLSRSLGVHPAIFSPPECHIIPPLYHLGYYGSVKKIDKPSALFHIPQQSSRAIHDNVEHLPERESDYLAALRRYTDYMYEKLKERSGKRIFVDKSPIHWRYLPFVSALYPEALYLVLTRNPCDVLVSIRKLAGAGIDDPLSKPDDFASGTFFGLFKHLPKGMKRWLWRKGASWHAREVMSQCVPSIAQFLRESKQNICRVSYEKLVAAPDAELQRVCAWIGVDYEEGLLDSERYTELYWKGLGDPSIRSRIGEKRQKSNAPKSWSDRRYQRSLLKRLNPQDVEVWGYSHEALMRITRAPMEASPVAAVTG